MKNPSTPTTSNSTDSKLALEGGTPVLANPLPTLTNRWGDEERTFLSEMVDQRSLFYWNGPQTQRLIENFRQHYPLDYVMPCSSGTAALHIAVAAAGLKPGDEIIVPPITDMGTVIGALYQLAVPVFADLEPDSHNLDPEDVRKKITAKTRAVIAVHLTGSPCKIDALRALCDAHDLVLIEDCAQAWGTRSNGRPVGTIGHIGCYSFNDFKHVSCGDGGIVASSDPRFGPLLQKYGDKAYDRTGGLRNPSFLAPNYRISEPQSAVAAAQMLKVEAITARRNALGTRLAEQLRDIPGIYPQQTEDGAHCTYWFYMFRIDETMLGVNRDTFAKALEAEGIPAGAGYIPLPLYQYDVFQDHNFFGGEWPLRSFGLTDMDYRTVHCPVAETTILTSVTLRIHEGLEDSHIDAIATAIRKVAAHYCFTNSARKT